MDIATARALIDLNTRFYAKNAASFSRTREAPWPGWRRVAGRLRQTHGGGSDLAVLDLACGNLRFERFLADELADASLTFYAFDNCPSLVADMSCSARVHVREADALTLAIEGRDPLANAPACELTACFGFLHHVPTRELRRRLLRHLAAHTAENGLMALSFWQFMHDRRLAARAEETRAEALRAGIDLDALDEGDHFLGWQGDYRSLRYCHHFSEEEIDDLAEGLARCGLREIDRFSADGAAGALNRYLVMQRATPTA